MPAREDAKAVARRLHALCGGGGVIRKAAARELAKRHPLDANELIADLLGLARRGDVPASCVLAAFVQALDQEAEQIPHVEELRRLAAIQSLHEVVALFADGPARRQMDPDEAARKDARAFSESLGLLKTKARNSRDPDVLSRVATSSNPAVVRNLLLNPRLTEALVVRIASRRPARPEPLVEIWRSARWSCRPAIRKTLAFNPYLPPEIGSKIVPLLARVDLEEMVADGSVHPSLRAQAQGLLRDDPGEPVPRPRGEG
jgi:hypothetical protein